jgi:hypothetical protein
MTMYVRVTAPMALTISSQDEDDDVLLDGSHPYAVLPLWAAQKPEFQSLWDDGKVEVATDTGFTNLITEIPASELPGTGVGSIPTSLHVEEIVDVDGHTVLRLADGTVAPGTASNYLVVTNATVGNIPSIAVEATADTNVALELSSLGTGSFFVKNSGGTMLETWGTNDAVHHMAFANSAAGGAVEFGVVGQAGDVDINAYPMGTGRFNVNQAPVITGVQSLNNQGGPRWSYNSPSNSLGQYAVQANSLAVGLPNPAWAADIVASPGDYLVSFNGGPQDVPIAGITGPAAGTNVYTLTGTWPANATGFPITIAAAAAQSYTLQASDVGKLIAVNSGGTFTVNIPLMAVPGFQLGARIELAQTGTGGVYVALADESITLISHQGWTALNGRGATATLTLVAQNTWLLAGSLD